MDYKEREARRRQEDRDLNRALIWVGAAIVLEFLLVLLNKHYFYYRVTSQEIELALAINSLLIGMRWGTLVGVLAFGIWALVKMLRNEKSGVQWVFTAACSAFLICAQVILTYKETGLQMLYWMVPAWAALALVYYLYQREFFLCALVSGFGVLGLWFVRHRGLDLSTVVSVLAIVFIAALVFWMKQNGGRLSRKEGAQQVLPEDASYTLMALSCLVSVAVIGVAVAAKGGTLAYYLLYAMIAWIFALLVYYTVKMM